MKVYPGDKFNYLTVKEILPHLPYERQIIKCLCDCGREKKVEKHNLVKGKTKTCGNKDCEYYRKIMSEGVKQGRGFNGNTYKILDNYVIGYTHTGEEFYIDTEDFPLVKQHSWNSKTKGYLMATINGKHIMLHRFIMNSKNGEIVDHINHNIKDNRKSNLRIVTTSQNQMNKGLQKNNTSGHRGISWHKNKQKWISQICLDGKLKYLGIFDNIEDAINARKEAEIKYFGEFNYQEI